MKIEELKQAVVSGTLPTDFLVLVCDSNYFLADQYIDTLCQKTNREKTKIKSIHDVESTTAFLFGGDNVVNVLKTEVFDEKAKDYSQFENVIVVCNKVDKKLEKSLTPFIVKMPKLLDWQIKAYIKVVCPGLTDVEADWLYAATSGNIYRIQLELNKIKLFRPEEQIAIFRDLARDQLNDLYHIDIFSLKNELIKPMVSDEVKTFMMNAQYATNIGVFGLIAMLLNDFKKALFITQKSGMTNEDLLKLGLTSKQIYAVKNSYEKLYKGERLSAYLKKNITFLSSINSRLVEGKLDFNGNEQQLLDYVICNILS